MTLTRRGTNGCDSSYYGDFHKFRNKRSAKKRSFFSGEFIKERERILVLAQPLLICVFPIYGNPNIVPDRQLAEKNMLSAVNTVHLFKDNFVGFLYFLLTDRLFYFLLTIRPGLLYMSMKKLLSSLLSTRSLVSL